jgi:Bacterial regulatory protein, Fis family
VPEDAEGTADNLLRTLRAGGYAETLEQQLATVDQAAAKAEQIGFDEYAHELREHRARLERCRKAGRIDDAIVEAICLAATFERFRADRACAAAIESFRRSHRPVVSNDQIRAVMSASDTRADAAAKLGISERQLRTRLRRMKWDRKSTTSAKE